VEKPKEKPMKKKKRKKRPKKKRPPEKKKRPEKRDPGRKCPECGERLTPGDALCGSCGYTLD
jgi:hypothetical protein